MEIIISLFVLAALLGVTLAMLPAGPTLRPAKARVLYGRRAGR